MSKVVFVGNVPYNMGEEQLIDVFKSVGQVVGFRLVYDRDTGKPKGYGFCEFGDHETAQSAVRNLNNVDVGGRPLRIDLADSDPFLEGKTTVRGELVDGGETRAQWREREEARGGDRGYGPRGGGGGPIDRERDAFLKSLPTGAPLPIGMTSLDVISQTLATMNPAQLIEVLAQMKAFVITHPDEARTLLASQPQFSYALFQSLLLNKIVDPAILNRMLAATSKSTPTLSSSQPHLPGPSGPLIPPAPARIAPTLTTSALPPPSAHAPPPLSATHTHDPRAHTHDPRGPPPGPASMSAPAPRDPRSQYGNYEQPYYHTPPPHTPQGPGGGGGGFYGGPPPSNVPMGRPPSTQAQGPMQGPNAPGGGGSGPGAGAGTGGASGNPLDAIPAEQRAMLMQVLAMAPEQINMLPQTERDAIMSLRSQLGGIA